MIIDTLLLNLNPKVLQINPELQEVLRKQQEELNQAFEERQLASVAIINEWLRVPIGA